MKNWITGLHGAIILGLMVSKIWVPTGYQSKVNDTIMVITASGFFVSKDFNTHSTVTETEIASQKEAIK